MPEILRERIKISEMDVITKENHIGKIIVSEEEIKSKIAEAGSAISEKYRGKPLLLVSILKGAFIFLADLCRAIDVP